MLLLILLKQTVPFAAINLLNLAPTAAATQTRRKPSEQQAAAAKLTSRCEPNHRGWRPTAPLVAAGG